MVSEFENRYKGIKNKATIVIHHFRANFSHRSVLVKNSDIFFVFLERSGSSDSFVTMVQPSLEQRHKSGQIEP